MNQWGVFLRNFTAYLKLEKGLSENSIDAYHRDVIKLIDFCKAISVSPKEVKSSNIKDLLFSLTELGISARSQARIISGIKQFFLFLILENELDIDPSESIEMPQIGSKLPEVLSLDEIDALMEAIDFSKKEGQRNLAILETLYSCGLRVSELVNLRFSDLYLDEGFIRVIGKGNKERLVPSSPSVEKELNKYLEQTRNFQAIKPGNENIVFLNRRGVKLTRVMIFTIIKELTQKTGLKKQVSPHTFRHSFATHLLEGGANLRAIQEMLGHESITTTEIYTHLDQRFVREAILNHHPRNMS
jgi:integrase/recombinase XerD